MKIQTLIVFLIVGFASSLCAQSSTTRPTWSKHPSQGGLDSNATAVPAEYSGAVSYLLESQFPARGWTLTTKLCAIRYSPTSGVLQFEDLRLAPPTITGWDTGYDRVYSCIVLDDLATKSSFLCTVWNSQKSKRRVIQLVRTSSGTFVQSNASVYSKKNAIWVGGSIVDSKLYVCNLQDFKISRYSDKNNDGKYELLDANFGLTIPTADPEDETDIDVNWALPLMGFQRLGTEHATLVRPPRHINHAHTFVYIENLSGVFSLKMSLPPEQKVLGLHYTELVNKQNCILVTGPPGVEFYVEAELPNATIIDLAVAQIQLSGLATVRLSQPLEAGWKIQVKTNQADVRYSSVETVSNEDISVLFRLDGADVIGGQVFQLYGDKFKNGIKGKCKDEAGTLYDTTINFISANEVHTAFPFFGGVPIPEYPKVTNITFWLVDAVTNARISNIIDVKVRHN